jgi:hypothetical protein
MQSNPDLDSARLALLVARAGLSRATKLRRPHFRLPSLRNRFTADEVVERLAAAPKPLICVARELGGSIEIKYSPLKPGTRELDWHERTVRDARERGGLLKPFFPTDLSINLDAILIYCLGWDESLILSLPVVEKWFEEYARGATMTCDHVDNPCAKDSPEYREAKARGARGILIFSSPADNVGKIRIKIREYT